MRLRCASLYAKARPSSILSGERPIPGTVLPGEKAACSICAKKFSGLRLSVMVPTRISGWEPLLAADEVRELHRVADEEDRRVVADQVVVALLGVELQREAAHVAPGVGAARLARDGGEACEHVGDDPLPEQRGPRE